MWMLENASVPTLWAPQNEDSNWCQSLTVNGSVVRLLRRVWRQNNSNQHIQGVLVQMTALGNVSDCTRYACNNGALCNGSIAGRGLTMWGLG